MKANATLTASTIPADATAPTGKTLPLLAGIPDQPDPQALPTALTAGQRGPEWMARYGCTPWCVMDHAGEDGEPGWHQGPKAEAVAPVPFVDSMPGDGPGIALAARVTQVSQDAQIFGIETRLWVDVDTETLELDVEQTDTLISRLEQFLPKLRALRGQLAEASAADFPADPVAKARYMAEASARVKAIDAAKASA